MFTAGSLAFLSPVQKINRAAKTCADGTLTERFGIAMTAFPSQHNSAGLCRVTKRRPCRICGKPNWCAYRADEFLSVCMRIRDGALKINQHGGAIFLHQKANPSLTELPLPIQPLVPLASLKTRDFVYRRLLHLSPATRYHQQLIGGARGLSARGLPTKHWSNYGSLPPRVAERDKLARQLKHTVCELVPALDSLRGVPGCWEDDRDIHLGQPYNDRHPWLLIPVRNDAG